jgi:hypothetical protein
MPFADILKNIDPKQIQGIAQGLGGVVDIFRPKRKPKKNRTQPSPPPPPPPPYRPPVNYERKGSNKTLLYVGIGVGVLAIGVMTILLVRNK